MDVATAFGLVLGLALTIYLFVALFRPEAFE